MCDKVIAEHGRMSMFVPDCYKNQNMCNNAVHNYDHALGFVPNFYKTQKMCAKVVSTYPSAIEVCFWSISGSRNVF